ncbi:MAG TPA: hypothetical protein VLV78_05290 [Thermoanaerobaculia bacterium]|nr:hypothetical protein [Thermoanaerobaculia bacterium]
MSATVTRAPSHHRRVTSADIAREAVSDRARGQTAAPRLTPAHKARAIGANAGGTWPNREYGNRALHTMVDEANKAFSTKLFAEEVIDFGAGNTQLPRNVVSTYEPCTWHSLPGNMCQERARGIYVTDDRWMTVEQVAGPTNTGAH